MVDARIELVQHPGGARSRQQCAGPLDEVVEVEQSATALGGLVAVEHRLGHGDERQRALEGFGRTPRVECGHEAVALAVERIAQLGLGLAQRLDEILAVTRGPSLGQEHVEVGFEHRLAGGERRTCEAVAGRVLRAAVGAEALGRRGPSRPVEAAVQHAVFDACQRVVGSKTEDTPQPGTEARDGLAEQHGGLQRLAVAERLADQRLEGEARGLAGQERDRTAERAAGCRSGLGQRIRPRCLEQLHMLQIVDYREACRDIGLEREQVQQPLAESVNGLDLQTSGRFHRAGEEFSGEREVGRARARRAGAQDGFGQRRVVEPRPVGQRVEHADRHVGRGRLGEGEAQDAGGRHVAEQQPHHALRQHMRFARAGVGRHPGGTLRMRGALLAGPRVFRHRKGGGAAHASLPSPPTIDHSLTRDRWS